MELKTGKFKPEYVSKMDFYLEGLDRQVKKPDENPSVGLILCASKNDEVVEYAMSRTMSPMMVSLRRIKEYEELKRIIVCTNSNLAAPKNYESVGFRLYNRKPNETESAYTGDYLYYEIARRGCEEIGKELRI